MGVVHNWPHPVGKVHTIRLQKARGITVRVRPAVIEVKMPIAGIVEPDCVELSMTRALDVERPSSKEGAQLDTRSRHLSKL